MNAIVVDQTTSYLTRQVRRWDRRLRAVDSLVWIPRGLMLGLAVSIAVAAAARMRPWLLPEQVAVVAAVAIGLGAGGALAVVWLWPRSTARAARTFDRKFALHERMSTALELAAGAIPYPDHLAERQLADATRAAQAVRAEAYLPARVRWREIVLVIVLAALLAYLLLVDNPQADKLRAQQAVQQAIADQADQIEELIEMIREDATLSAQEQDALTQPLEEARDILQELGITQEEAVAAMAEAQRSLQELSGSLRPDQAAPYQAAAEALAGSERTSNLARALSRPDLEQSADALDALAEDLADAALSDEERQDLANRLDQAADALEQSNPAVAEQLRQAAEALRENDMEATQQALREAAERLREQQQEMETSAQAQAAREISQQLSEGQEELAQAGQERPDEDMPGSNSEASAQQSQPSDQQPGQQQLDQPQAGQDQAAEFAGEGEQPGASQQAGQPEQGGESSQAGGEEGQPMAQDAGQAQQPDAGDGSAQGESQPGALEQPGGQPSEGAAAAEGEAQGQVSAPGVGEGEGGAGANITSGQAGAQPQDEISTGNAPGDSDGAIEEFQPEYAPSTIGGQSDQVLDVGGQTSDSGGEPIQEGEIGPNPPGESTLSYAGVFGNYQDIVSDALDSGRIPLDQRDVIHDYFSSLEP